MDARARWNLLLQGEIGDGYLLDVGTTTVTGACASGSPEFAALIGWVGHPVLQTLPVDAETTQRLGSDFDRAGLLFPPPELDDDTFVDMYGVTWLMVEGSAAPLEHPLQAADVFGIAGHTRPAWPGEFQPGRRGADRLVVADAPTSGIVETCFSLRNSWQFLMDLTEDWRAANALLDWALESVASSYEQMLAVLPEQPDVVLYGDDYGYQGGMFFSDEDFRTFIRPRLRTLFSRIRRATDAAICFHCCGAVHPILGDLADLGVESLNLQNNAKGMGVDAVRRALPSSMVLHGYTDIQQLGASLRAGKRGSVAILAEEFVASGLAIAAPVDNLPGTPDLGEAVVGGAFLKALDGEDISRLRRLGPVEGILARATAAALAVDQNSAHASEPARILPKG